MIDTLRVRVSGRLKDPMPPGWRKENWREETIETHFGIMRLSRGRLRHGPTGLCLWVSGGEVRLMQVEVPCLLFPSNGTLIKTQGGLDRAVRRALTVLQEVCELRPNQPFPITRIDLVGHAKVPPDVLVRVYRNLRLPGIRRDPVYWPGESLFWRGNNRKCRMYDKGLRDTGKAGEISRIEWQLHTTVITGTFGHPLALESLRIEECYGVFVRLCRAFTPRRLVRRPGVVAMLAMANQAQWEYGGVALVEHLRPNYKPRAFQNLLRAAATMELETEGINLSQAFPGDFDAYVPVDSPKVYRLR